MYIKLYTENEQVDDKRLIIEMIVNSPKYKMKKIDTYDNKEIICKKLQTLLTEDELEIFNKKFREDEKQTFVEICTLNFDKIYEFFVLKDV